MTQESLDAENAAVSSARRPTGRPRPVSERRALWRAWWIRLRHDFGARRRSSAPHALDVAAAASRVGQSDGDDTVARLKRSVARRDRQIRLLALPYLVLLAPVLLPFLAVTRLRQGLKRRPKPSSRRAAQGRARSGAWERALISHGAFDADWYVAQHPGVARLNRKPIAHFVDVGVWLERAPNPNFDAEFYRDTYRDVGEGTNPVLHFLETGLVQGRPTNSVAAAAELDALLPAKTAARKKISYCIPIMNRFGDLEASLPFNLWENAAFSGDVEFVVLLFDRDDRAADWLAERFAAQIAEGYLRVERSDALEQWHFGRAKNGFRNLLRGAVYSSLDGDNFVTAGETRALLDAMDLYPGGFVFHHFQGHWGDGTCGRISLPAELYRHVGYDETFLPTQFDDIDLILSVLSRYPALPYLCHEPETSVLDKPGRAHGFARRVSLGNPVVFTGPPPGARLPVNPKGGGHLKRDRVQQAMNAFNATASFHKNAWALTDRQSYWRENAEARMELMEAWPRDAAFETVFGSEASLPSGSRFGEGNPDGGPALLTCIKDERRFLPGFLAHYRARGVSRFLIVDDHSRVPLTSDDLGSDVEVVRPNLGEFNTGKALWLETLLLCGVSEGSWVLTADVDERVDLPPGIESFTALAERLEASGLERAPGLLVDLLPAPGELPQETSDPFKVFTHRCDERGRVARSYARHASVRWGFGRDAAASWCVDARHHAFGTYDSLRKIPLFRHRPWRHLHDGFHATYTRKRRGFDPEAIEPGVLLPVRHYKLVKLLFDEEKSASLKTASGFHPRSAENVQRIFGAEAEAGLDRLRQLPSVPYDPADFARLPPPGV